MLKKTLLIITIGAVSACSTATPPPQLVGQKVRPLNPTKWDYKTALGEKQKELSVKKISSGAVNE